MMAAMNPSSHLPAGASGAGDTQPTLRACQHTLRQSRRSGDRAAEAATLAAIAQLYSTQGDKQQAIAYYQQALPLLRQLGDKRTEAVILNNIGAATFDEPPRTVDDLLARIDECQYRAKNAGKDRFVYHAAEKLAA